MGAQSMESKSASIGLDTRSCLLQGDHMGGLCGKPEGKKVRESFLKGDPLYVCVTQSACQSACRLPRA